MLAEVTTPMLSISVKDFRGYIAVVKPEGHLLLGETTEFSNRIRTVIQAYDRIIIDLGAVSRIDGTGVGELLTSYAIARSVGVFIALANLMKRTHDLTVITKLATVFPIIDDKVFGKERPKQQRHQSSEADGMADATSRNEGGRSKESRLLPGETVGIKILPSGRWCIGEVLEICRTKILLNSDRALLQDASVKLIWGDNFIVGIVESCSATNGRGYRTVVQGYHVVYGSGAGTDLKRAA